MKRTNLTGLALAFALVIAGAAEAKQWRYAGGHPRTGEPKGGWCFIEVPHVHLAAPPHAELLYRDHGGVYVFIGDPTPFGYEGPRHAYYGHHPVVLEVLIGVDEPDDRDVEYCYLDGPHFHGYAPPPEMKFVDREDVHYYAGEYPDEYRQQKPKLARVNTVYRPILVEHPIVHEAPPPEYHGPIVEVKVAVPVPRVEVNLPVPSVHVVVPGVTVVPAHVVEERHVIVEEHHHHKHKKHKHKKWKDD